MIVVINVWSYFISVLSTKEDAIVTEIVDGLIVSKPAKKIEYLIQKRQKSESDRD